MSEVAECVLVVDDDLAVRSSLAFALEMEGFAVHTYGSGAALQKDPDLARGACLVVDYYMPGMNGLELVDQLAERDWHFPIILITAGAAQDLPEATVYPNIQDILEKPLDDDALSVRIHTALATFTSGQS